MFPMFFFQTLIVHFKGPDLRVERVRISHFFVTYYVRLTVYIVQKTYLDLDTKKCLGLKRIFVYGKLIAYIGCMLVWFFIITKTSKQKTVC